MDSSVDNAILLDELDHRILVQLQQDAALTNQELAERVFSSAPTCLRRVRRLRELGVIQGVVALIDPAVVGLPLTAIVEVTLDVQSAERLAAFEARAVVESAVLQCYRVSGGPDFVVIVGASDMAAYHALVGRLFNASSNVRNVRSFFSVHRAKFETRVLLERVGEGGAGAR
ncbi:Lrp/AsnC family transcriptional regulator [Verticiella sediminum]|uniref:Lrp/AsnC family transcriptional regulator n=1 Tax=Verticiella sediminum TaxID=1247510 RepID=A0A556AKP7_9BURK|nr:Lrp/AsnC family transcriptional regulator [Verticiella sediminum]TSH93459.1 Lrp/AsnC family transcriptional regulator [Verticiella sediminum]